MEDEGIIQPGFYQYFGILLPFFFELDRGNSPFSIFELQRSQTLFLKTLLKKTTAVSASEEFWSQIPQSTADARNKLLFNRVARSYVLVGPLIHDKVCQYY